MRQDPFLTTFARDTFYRKYALTPSQTWEDKAHSIVRDVCDANDSFHSPLMSKEELKYLRHAIANMWILPGGRYIYYAGRKRRFWNNCLLLAVEEDTREAWALLAKEAMASLMTGAGIGVWYGKVRPQGVLLSGTGGISSGPVSLMEAINELGRQVMQGGARRSAIYASLPWNHGDVEDFLKIKDWDNQPTGVPGVSMGDLKRADFNARAPLDMTNISLNYDDDFLASLVSQSHTLGTTIPSLPSTFIQNVRYAMMNGEPGFSFNFGHHKDEVLRNACTEITSSDSSDVCNLASLNLARIPSLAELQACVGVATKFLVCGTIRAELPYEKVYKVREKNRRLGLGLMGVHEWLLKRGYRYEMNEELKDWLRIYRDTSESAADEHCDRLFLSRAAGKRAIAPTGTISILAGPTTSGIEPLFAAAYKRRFLDRGVNWRYEYVVDPIAQKLVEVDGVDPEQIETAMDLAEDVERRIKFQYEVQQYVDHAISSTINLPAWGSENNNEDRVHDMAGTIAKYAHGLRGLTFYPDGARGGQPLTAVPYREAAAQQGVVLEEHDACKGGVCGL